MPKEKTKILKTIKEIRVISDPYRREIMSRLSLLQRPSTSKEVAVEMDEAPSKVNYHMGILLKYGFLKIHHTKIINGITAKYYKRTATKFVMDMNNTQLSRGGNQAVMDTLRSSFDTARDVYTKRMNKNMQTEDGISKDKHDYLSTRRIYLNDVEQKKLIDYIDNLSQNDAEGRKLYYMFTAIIDED